jgi:outer membrane protein assembly factor BamD (BamD/ComL family)
MKSRVLGQFIMLCALVCLVTFTACADNRAAELYETAQFEELQNNKEHALKLYEEITVKYAESEYAAKASARIIELGKKQ